MNTQETNRAPWRHSRELSDDWGFIREGDRLVAVIRTALTAEQENEHRKNGTDPTEAVTSRVVALWNVCLEMENPAAEIAALREPLAVIHRDGGHYTEEHGVKKSVEDALKILADNAREMDSLRHQNARLRGVADMQDKLLDGAIADEESVSAQRGALLAALKDELCQSFNLAEERHAAEKLGGNIVKLEYWKGELAALHRIRQTIAAAEGRAES